VTVLDGGGDYEAEDPGHLPKAITLGRRV